MVPTKPTLFIGSSGASLPVAEAIKTGLSDSFDVTVWNKNVFRASKGTLEVLLEVAERFDFGAFLFAEDDFVEKKGKLATATRDNVIFECGMFFGSVGPDRTFFLTPVGAPDLDLPTDLSGVTSVRYRQAESPADWSMAVASSCKEIKDNVRLAALPGPSYSFLAGIWRQNWKAQASSNAQIDNQSDADVLVVGSSFLAEFESLGTRYRLKARIQNESLVTGIWFDKNLKSGYHGSFQLRVSPLGKQMLGKWIGWRSSGPIGAGDWIWDRLGD